MTAVEAKMNTLKSYLGEEFDIDDFVAMESQMLNNMVADDCADAVIRLPNIASMILVMEIEYCKMHVEAEPRRESADSDKENKYLKAWDAEYVQAANYMNINGLLVLTCRIVSDIIKGKTPEEIHKTINIENDLTPKEEQDIHKENHWEFE